MKSNTISRTIFTVFITSIISQPVLADNHVNPAPNGITLPEGYKDWRVISQSHRLDNKSMRIILGNDIAIDAARAKNVNPWPDGAILAKLVWKEQTEEFWPAAMAPGDFIHAEFMFKDSQKYKATGGWGYARWLGLDQKPYGNDENFAQECVSCHLPVKGRDYVFTTPVTLP